MTLPLSPNPAHLAPHAERLSAILLHQSNMTGREWIVEAHGCDPASLRDERALASLFEAIVTDLALRPVRPPLWHAFPGAGGITGLLLLAESHLACHTFPEHGSICLNLFCCKLRPDWDFDHELAERLGARRVSVRRVDRPYGDAAAGAWEAIGDVAPGPAVLP